MKAGRWALVGASVLLVLAPASAGAAGLEDEPRPSSWPTVDKPSGSINSSDPRPVSLPTVKKPANAQGSDPRPASWPTAKKE
ncbi:hypothetical protein [Kribbella sp. NPDC051770]|uniref:hypothetical protein n=1 Tax=Kribbella sp. NPDC051770 TaxID=3155413 RepID=UPI00341284D9